MADTLINHQTSTKKLIVTHHAPDLDAISSVWLLQRFDAQHYGSARVAFVNPGDTISEEEAATYGATLAETTHVDTGLGEFDHHDEARAAKNICAATLVYDYLVAIHPELAVNEALQAMLNYIVDIDHFGEVFWPEANNSRYMFMLHNIISSMDYTLTEDDAYQVSFGLKCLDFVYAGMDHFLSAQKKIAQKGIFFNLPFGKALAIETRNDEVVPTAQKDGIMLVIHKDTGNGRARIKARPDSNLDLRNVYEKIIAQDPIGYWFYHPSGKMVLNGSSKMKGKPATPLSLDELIKIVQEELG